MFKNLKIGVRLGIGFAAVLILMAVVAFVGVTRVNELNGSIDNLTKDKMVKTKYVNEISGQLAAIARAQRNMLIYKTDEMNKESLEKLDNARKQIADLIEKMDQMHKSEAGQKLFDAVKEKRKIYIEFQTSYESAIKAKSWDEAMKILTDHLRPTYDDYLKALKDSIDHEEEGANKVGVEAGALATSTATLVISLALGAFIIGAGMAFWVTRSITRPLDEAVDVANNLSEGNLNVKIVVDSQGRNRQVADGHAEHGRQS